MADLIKKIKIKKQDGTFTDYIPIGAEAKNISTNDGDSVELKLSKKPYYFDTVADMKAANLKEGDCVCTLGYYSVNDGGAAEYRITSTESQVDYQEEVGNLYATLIINLKYLDIRKLGIFPDTQNIMSVSLYNAFLFANSKKCITYIPKGTYIVKSKEIVSTGNDSTYALIIPEDSEVYFEKGAIIKLIDDAESWSRVVAPKSNVNIYGELTIDGNCMSVTAGNEHMAGLFVYNQKNISIEKLNSYNCYGDNVQLSGDADGYGNIFINELNCKKAGRKNLVFENGTNVHIHNAYLDNTEGNSSNWEGSNSIDVEPFGTSHVKELTIDKVETFGTGNDFTSGTTQDHANKCILNFGTFIQHGGEFASYSMTFNIDNLIIYNGFIALNYAPNLNANNIIFYNQENRAIGAAGQSAGMPRINVNNIAVFGTKTISSNNPCIRLQTCDATIKNIYIQDYYYNAVSFYANVASVIGNVFIDSIILKDCGYATGNSDSNSIIGSAAYTNLRHNVLINKIVNNDSRDSNLPNSLIKLTTANETTDFVAKRVINNASYTTVNTRYGNFTAILEYGGATDQRPTNPYVGIQYYDTTLNKLITYNGTNWVNLDGSAL